MVDKVKKRACFIPLYSPMPGPVMDCRCENEESCRERNPGPVESWRSKQQIDQIKTPLLSSRETAFALDSSLDDAIQNSKRQLRWIPGGNAYRPVFRNQWMEDASESKIRPIRSVAGPSSSTDAILQTALYLGINHPHDLLAVRLACVAWMIPSFDHSFHEVFLAGVPFGLTYGYSSTDRSKMFTKLWSAAADTLFPVASSVVDSMQADACRVHRHFLRLLAAEFRSEEHEFQLGFPNSILSIPDEEACERQNNANEVLAAIEKFTAQLYFK